MKRWRGLDVVMVPLRDCKPPHGVHHEYRRIRIANSLHGEGWKGRPLLGQRYNGRIQLWTGSHRYAAAHSLNLAIVPVVLIPNCRIDFEDRLARGVYEQFYVYLKQRELSTHAALFWHDMDRECRSGAKQIMRELSISG